MVGKRVLTFVLCCNSLVFGAQDQKAQEPIPQNIASTYYDVMGLLNIMLRLDKLAEDYCKKYSNVLPVWCANCRQRRLYLGELSGCLFAQMVKDAAAGKGIEKLKATFENFLKLLASVDTKESDMVTFVLKEIKELEYHCTNCQSTSWEKMP